MHLFNILFNLYKKLTALINPIITISQAPTVLERFWGSPKVTQQESCNSDSSDPNSLFNHSAILFTQIVMKGTDDYSRKLVLHLETPHLPLSWWGRGGVGKNQGNYLQDCGKFSFKGMKRIRISIYSYRIQVRSLAFVNQHICISKIRTFFFSYTERGTKHMQMFGYHGIKEMQMSLMIRTFNGKCPKAPCFYV